MILLCSEMFVHFPWIEMGIKFLLKFERLPLPAVLALCTNIPNECTEEAVLVLVIDVERMIII